MPTARPFLVNQATARAPMACCEGSCRMLLWFELVSMGGAAIE